jgi:hypothetical protein
MENGLYRNQVIFAIKNSPLSPGYHGERVRIRGRDYIRINYPATS